MTNMTIKYRIDVEYFADVCEGRGSDWRTGTEYHSTYEDALEKAETYKKGMALTGNWKIVKRTIDEVAFMVEDITVKEFNWWKEIGAIEYANREIARLRDKITKLEESKKRVRSATGLVKKDSEIIHCLAEIERLKAYYII